jgi:tether containing UBX domain for GLUT4
VESASQKVGETKRRQRATATINLPKHVNCLVATSLRTRSFPQRAHPSRRSFLHLVPASVSVLWPALLELGPFSLDQSTPIITLIQSIAHLIPPYHTLIMASHVVVLDAAFKRVQVKVTPATTLRTVLEQACDKFQLDPDQYILKNTKDRPIDLSLPFRLSGLVSGAKLQLVQSSRSPSVVKVALQLPAEDNSPRLEDHFPSNTPLWLILRKFEDGVAGNTNKLNLTERSAPSTDTGSGYLCYLQPCLNIGGSAKELSTFLDLQKSLAQLGHNHGSVLIRLSFKNEGLPMEGAKARITTYLQALLPQTAASSHGAHAAPVGQLSSLPNADADNSAVPREDDAAQDPSEDTIMSPAPDLAPAEQPAQEDDVIASSSTTQMPSTESQFPSLDTGVSIYAAPSDNTPFAARQAYNEADYMPSVEHANAHQASLTKLGRNTRLPSDKEIAANSATKAAALNDIKAVTLRIRFPDMMMVEWRASQSDTSESLYTKVKEMLDDPSLKFRLQITQFQMKPLIFDSTSQQRLIKDLGIRDRSLITFVWDDSVAKEVRDRPLLKQTLRKQAKELEVKEPAAEEEVKQAPAPKAEEPKKKSSLSFADKEAKLKKMMGFGRK